MIGRLSSDCKLVCTTYTFSGVYLSMSLYVLSKVDHPKQRSIFVLRNLASSPWVDFLMGTAKKEKRKALETTTVLLEQCYLSSYDSQLDAGKWPIFGLVCTSALERAVVVVIVNY